MSQYWLFRWIDDQSVADLHSAKKSLANAGSRDKILQFAREQMSDKSNLAPSGGNELVAGTGMDLSGIHECSFGKCLKKKADVLLRRTWHSFDNVVVNGLDASRFRGIESGAEIRGRAIDLLLNHLELALYIREIGAEDFIVFGDKPHYCAEHLSQHAEEVGFAGGIEAMTADLEMRLLSGYSFSEFNEVDDRLVYAYTHPLLEASTVGILKERPFPSAEMVGARLSRTNAQSYAGLTLMNSALARRRGAPLGEASSDQPALQPGTRGRASREDVAFHISLPVLQAIPMREVLKLRQDHAAEFHALQFALRKGIEERIKALPDADAETVADSVYDDVIEPEIVKLDRKITAAADSTIRRYAASAAVGSAITTVGLLSFAPIAATGVAVGAAASLATYIDWMKDRKEVELSDLHFLWRLDQAASSHADSDA